MKQHKDESVSQTGRTPNEMFLSLAKQRLEELAKSLRRIPTKLTMPKPPPEDLPPEEYKKAEAEYEQKMKEYWRESIYGANYWENPYWQLREPYWDNEWEAIKHLIL